MSESSDKATDVNGPESNIDPPDLLTFRPDDVAILLATKQLISELAALTSSEDGRNDLEQVLYRLFLFLSKADTTGRAKHAHQCLFQALMALSDLDDGGNPEIFQRRNRPGRPYPTQSALVRDHLHAVHAYLRSSGGLTNPQAADWIARELARRGCSAFPQSKLEGLFRTKHKRRLTMAVQNEEQALAALVFVVAASSR